MGTNCDMIVSLLRSSRFAASSLPVRVSLVAQMVKNLHAMQETWVLSLSLEDALEEEMATHSSILAYKIPWTEELGGPQSLRSQTAGHH